jgi:hypothetical protein
MQGDGIHLRVAGNVLHSSFPSGLIAHSPAAKHRDGRWCMDIYGGDRELFWFGFC